MKVHVSAILLLGLIGYASAEMDMGTWCMTYLSTYLEPVSNAHTSGGVPIASSLRPTFAVDSLTSSIRGPGVESELTSIDPITDAARSESSILEAEPTENSPDSDVTSLDSTVGIPTSSTLMTDTTAMPTPTGIIEPAGRSIILAIIVSENEKRDINKRASIDNFVGDNNPDVCTFARTFNLAEDQLFESGVPIHYSNEDYRELVGRDLPEDDSVTKTFRVTSRRLFFENDGLPNGQAEFCQNSDGLVYVTFTGGPVGCVPVQLAVYDVTQCQNGRLVGVDDSTTISMEVQSTSGFIESGTATNIESDPPEQGTVTTGSGASEIRFTGSSALDTSTAISSGEDDTAATSSAIPNPQPSSELTSESVSVGPTGIEEVASGSDTVDNTSQATANEQTSTEDEIVEDTTTGTSSQGITTDVSVEETTTDAAPEESTIDISPDETGTTIVNPKETTTDTTQRQETTEMTPGETAPDSTMDNTITEPTSVSTGTTIDLMPTTSAASALQCNDLSTPYNILDGPTYDLFCDSVIDGQSINVIEAPSLTSCIQSCADIDGCIGVQFLLVLNRCQRLSEVLGDPSGYPGSDVALLREGDATDTSTVLPVDTSTEEVEATTSADTATEADTTATMTADPTTDIPAATTSASQLSCENLANPYTDTSDSTDRYYFLNCNTLFEVTGSFESVPRNDLVACMELCSIYGGCNAVLYDKTTQECELVSSWEGGSPNLNFDFAAAQS